MRVRGAGLIIVALMAAIGGCAGQQQATAPDIFVMRHLNTPAGVTDPDLTSDGMTAALRLVDVFKRDKPAAIYVSRTKRAQQTVAPLARSVGVTPTLYDPADTPALIVAVTRETGTVLIVGHSNTVPDIIERLGGSRPAPLVHEDFGDLWQIDGSTRTTTRTKVAN